jgi:CubicO group peptidase (beta-lactamase class C family)
MTRRFCVITLVFVAALVSMRYPLNLFAEEAWAPQPSEVCGHGGLFSTAVDLAVYAQMILNGGSYGGKRILKAGTVDLLQQRQNLPAGSSRALGWDTPFPGSFAGDLAATRAIMHTGFTGTSVYIDLERNAFIILLTNRVHPLRENDKIESARPEIHSAILRAIRRNTP